MNRGLWPALVVALCLPALALVLRMYRQGHWTAPVGFGCAPATHGPCFARENASLMPPRALVYRGGGYDGQFYFYIASVLFTPDAAPARLDSEPFRMARIGYAGLSAAVARSLGAGPAGLIVLMYILPLVAHVLSVLCVYLYARDRAPDFAPAAAWITALNPVQLLAARLALGDALALPLALIATTLLLPARASTGSRAVLRFGAGGLSLVLALLSKETTLPFAVFIGCAGCAALLEKLRRRGSGNAAVTLIPILAALLSGLCLWLWWRAVGFSPGLAAERGGPPFSGLFAYLSAPDAPFAPRNLLVLLLAFWVALSGLLFYRAARDRDGSGLAAALGLGSGLIFPVSATMEYWGVEANVSRLFAPFVLIVTLPGALVSSGARRAARGLAIFFACFCLVLLYRDARAAPPLEAEIMDFPRTSPRTDELPH